MTTNNTLTRQFIVTLLTVSIVASAMVPAGCFPPYEAIPTPAGGFEYRAYDRNNDLVVYGWMTLVRQDSVRITGEWHFAAARKFEYFGPQVGNGKYYGRLKDSEFHINLNPGWVDNNVYLRGAYDSTTIEGEWSWVTFIGLTDKGRFRAVRK